MQSLEAKRSSRKPRLHANIPSLSNAKPRNALASYPLLSIVVLSSLPITPSFHTHLSSFHLPELPLHESAVRGLVLVPCLSPFANAFCLSAYSLTTNAQTVSAHNLFLLCTGNNVANSSPLALSTASTGTSKSVRGFWFGIGLFGSTKAPTATGPVVVPSSAKITL